MKKLFLYVFLVLMFCNVGFEMKRLLTYLFLILLSVCSINQSVVFAETKQMVYLGGTASSGKYQIIIQSPDPSFKNRLEWNGPYGFGDFIMYPEGINDYKGYKKFYEKYGSPCFDFKKVFTYDAKQYAYIFTYSSGSGQENLCVNEVYKIYTEPPKSIYYTKGLNEISGKAEAGAYRITWSEAGAFAVVVSNATNKLCFKYASNKGVVDQCYDLKFPREVLGKIVNTRIKAIRLREEAKGNIVDTSTPVETSITDTLGPIIDVPGKLIAKNDQVILSGKITDENNIASVKIDNQAVTLDKKGNFKIALYVPLDGSKVSIEAIDKFANKTSRTIVIFREQRESGEQIVKLPSLNPTKIDAKTNPDALALIVGITNYKNIPISIYADKDAKLFADYAYRSLGISRDKTKLLVNDSANYIEIMKSLKRWLKNEIVADKSDVYVFFAGHGLVSDNQKDLYLIPYDGETSLLTDTAFKRSNLFSLIEEANPGSITAFFDTCYSGLTRQNEMLVADARPIKIVADETSLPSNVNLISAASNNEIASSLEGAEHGMFSYYLMEGLGGNADLDQNKNITVGELHEYVKNRVKEKAAKLGRNQNPQVSGNKDKVLVKLN